jgi:hypothetical protein
VKWQKTGWQPEPPRKADRPPLDKPVSNSGRLKTIILDVAGKEFGLTEGLDSVTPFLVQAMIEVPVRCRSAS